jgi:hypothetical protein
MPHHRILFSNTKDAMTSRLGGLPMLPDPEEWPTTPDGEPLMLLASLAPGLLDKLFPDYKIPKGHLLSIFMAFEPDSRRCIRGMAVNDPSDKDAMKSGFSKVILHKASDKPCKAPKGAPEALPMKEMTLKFDPDGDKSSRMKDRGDNVSKVEGIPGWIQDSIKVPGHAFVMQFEDYEIGKMSKDHGGLFGDGNGYLFLKKGLPAKDPGVFFVQFS